MTWTPELEARAREVVDQCRGVLDFFATRSCDRELAEAPTLLEAALTELERLRAELERLRAELERLRPIVESIMPLLCNLCGEEIDSVDDLAFIDNQVVGHARRCP